MSSYHCSDNLSIEWNKGNQFIFSNVQEAILFCVLTFPSPVFESYLSNLFNWRRFDCLGDCFLDKIFGTTDNIHSRRLRNIDHFSNISIYSHNGILYDRRSACFLETLQVFDDRFLLIIQAQIHFAFIKIMSQPVDVLHRNRSVASFPFCLVCRRYKAVATVHNHMLVWQSYTQILGVYCPQDGFNTSPWHVGHQPHYTLDILKGDRQIILINGLKFNYAPIISLVNFPISYSCHRYLSRSYFFYITKICKRKGLYQLYFNHFTNQPYFSAKSVFYQPDFQTSHPQFT